MSRFDFLCRSAFLLAALPGFLASCNSDVEQIKPYQVTADSRDDADMDTDLLTIRRKPHCGTDAYNGQGVNGEGLLERQGQRMEVIIEPCVTTGEVVKTPDGRILFLKELRE